VDGGDEQPDLSSMLDVWVEDCEFSDLTLLELNRLNVSDGCSRFIDGLKGTKIRTLSILGCINISQALSGFSQLFSSLPGALATFRINFEDDEAEESIQALEDFLKICPHLRNLEIDVGVHRLIDVPVILRHGPGVLSLALGTALAYSIPAYSAADLGRLLRVCPTLKYLAINLPDPELNRVIDLADGLALGTESNDSVRTLVSIQQLIHQH
jgi:hypothetical protein